MFELSQRCWRTLDAESAGALAALRDRGRRASPSTGASDLRLDPLSLADRGVRFVKLPGAMLLGPRPPAPSTWRSSDLAPSWRGPASASSPSGSSARRTVPDLIDLDVPLAQGFVFGRAARGPAPRSVHRAPAVPAAEPQPAPTPVRPAPEEPKPEPAPPQTPAVPRLPAPRRADGDLSAPPLTWRGGAPTRAPPVASAERHDQTKVLGRPIPVVSGLAEIATGYDLILCDVWGVLHNGLVAYRGRLATR